MNEREQGISQGTCNIHAALSPDYRLNVMDHLTFTQPVSCLLGFEGPYPLRSEATMNLFSLKLLLSVFFPQQQEKHAMQLFRTVDKLTKTPTKCLSLEL